MLLKFAYEDFIADRQFRNTTERNIKNYRQLLYPFINYCLELGISNVEEVTHTHLRDYLIVCQSKGNKPSTINSKIQRTISVSQKEVLK